MNEESGNSLTPSGGDALEARIVAWVLGEASPFAGRTSNVERPTSNIEVI